MTESTILAALLALGAHGENSRRLAEAVNKYARTAEEAAFIISWGRNETHFAERLLTPEGCRRWECDHGQAVGFWQVHRGAAGEDWARLPGSVDIQVKVATRLTRWALTTCHRQPLCAFRVLGGLRSDVPLKGEAQRMADFDRARRLL